MGEGAIVGSATSTVVVAFVFESLDTKNGDVHQAEIFQLDKMSSGVPVCCSASRCRTHTGPPVTNRKP